MRIEIKSWITGKILFEREAGSLKLAVELACKQGADLRDADLSDAVLRGAVLRGADLSDAVLRGAVLRGADLSGAVLRGADLSDADLSGADLSDAVLRGAVLSDADLSDAVLRGAVLSDDQVIAFRDDLWAVLSAAPKEAQAVRAALAEGRVNGSVYQGECACLVGTIANARHCGHTEIPNLKPNPRRPAEQWFMQIKPGDTPDKSAAAKRAVEWIDQWLENVRGAFSA
jgi:hypothetical protein